MKRLRKASRRAAPRQPLRSDEVPSYFGRCLEWLRGSPHSMESPSNGYGGPERRRHKMFVTKNTEYHFKDEVCVAVRDRRSGRWLASHLALRRRLAGSVRFGGPGCAVPRTDPPRVGEALFFGLDGRELVTSLLCAIERPERQLVLEYAAVGH